MTIGLAVDNAIRRSRLRELDACLLVLENANERGVERVPEALAVRVAAIVPTVYAGMIVSDAIDRVFEAQELWVVEIAQPAPPARRTRRRRPLVVSEILASRDADFIPFEKIA